MILYTFNDNFSIRRKAFCVTNFTRNSLLIVIVFTIGVIFFSIFATCSTRGTADHCIINMSSPNSSSITPSTMSYTPHHPVLIEGNADFHTQASVEGWSGIGTVDKPYIISGLKISGPKESYLIEIRNTDVHFRIKNCFLQEGDGIRLTNVCNGHLINNKLTKNRGGINVWYSENNSLTGNLIINNMYGISLSHSQNITLVDNIVTNLSIRGISLSQSENCTLINNTIANINGSILSDYPMYAAIYLHDSNNVTLWGNTVANNKFHTFTYYAMDGIRFDSCVNCDLTANQVINNDMGIRLNNSPNTTLTSNTIANNRFDGISISKTDNTILISNKLINNGGVGITVRGNGCTLTNNIIANNEREGIVLGRLWSSNRPRSSSNCSLSNNTVIYNKKHGVLLDSYAANHTISESTFYCNNMEGSSSQAYDNGSNNLFVNNFWDEWISPDANNDDIVDNPYSLDGVANNHDYSPLIHPFNSIDTFDSDGDRLINIYENLLGTNPRSTDSDGDGIDDFEEIYEFHSDPTDSDSDDDFFPDGWDSGWWGNPNKNWDNPLTRGVTLILILIGICGLLAWIFYFRLHLSKLQQDLDLLLHQFQQYTQQFQDTISAIQTLENLEEIEAAANHITLSFESYESFYLFAQQLVRLRWLPPFLRPTLTDWDNSFALITNSFRMFQQTLLKHLEMKY